MSCLAIQACERSRDWCLSIQAAEQLFRFTAFTASQSRNSVLRANVKPQVDGLSF